MDADANKQLVMRFCGRVGTWSSPQRSVADDYVRHDLRPTQAAPGPPGQARIAEQFRAAFPDLRWRVGQWGGAAPTGKHAEFSGVNIFRFGDDGKVTEIWNHRDDLGSMEQLGAAVYAGASDDAY